MSAKTEQLVVGNVVKEMFSALHCTKAGILSQNEAATEDAKIGQVLEDDSGDYIPVATGTNANAILLTHVTAEDWAAGDVPVLILERGPATVVKDNLTIATGQETTALAALEALGIIAADLPENYEEGLDS